MEDYLDIVLLGRVIECRYFGKREKIEVRFTDKDKNVRECAVKEIVQR